jgi:hypothetical protein
MAGAAVNTFENPGSVDEVIREIEDSGYPVDGATKGFIRQPDDPSVATDASVATSLELDSAQKKCDVPIEDNRTSGGDGTEESGVEDIVAQRASGTS